METCPEPVLNTIIKCCSKSTLRSCLRLNKTFRKLILYDLTKSPTPNYLAIAKLTKCAMCQRGIKEVVLCPACHNGMFFVNSELMSHFEPGFKYKKTWRYERLAGAGRMLYDDYYTIDIDIDKGTYTLTRNYTDCAWDPCGDKIVFSRSDGRAWKLVENSYESDDHNFPGCLTKRGVDKQSLSRLLRICWKGPFLG